MKTYTITHDGSRWYDFPYRVTRDGWNVTHAMTKWGARLAIRADLRKLAKGEHVVWKGVR